MTIVIGGVAHPYPNSVSFLEEPRFAIRMGNDAMRRRTGVLPASLCLHTTKGIPGGKDQRPQVIRPGLGPAGDAAERCARSWSSSDRAGAAHLIVDFDGQVIQTADLARVCAYHAGPVNGRSIGIEVVQGSEAELYEGQLDATVRLCDWLAAHFRITRQVQWPYHRRPPAVLAKGAAGVSGAYGHRDVTTNRGRGDPGDALIQRMIAAGWAPVDWSKA
jgi:hypothetical protein